MQRWCQGFESECVGGLGGDLGLLLSLLAGADCSSSSRFDRFKQHFTVGALLARLRNLVQSILRFPEGQSELKLRSLPVQKSVHKGVSEQENRFHTSRMEYIPVILQPKNSANSPRLKILTQLESCFRGCAGSTQSHDLRQACHIVVRSEKRVPSTKYTKKDDPS